MSEIIPWREGSRVGYRVDGQTGCWVWCGAITPNGYGRVGLPGSRKTSRTAQAHRAVYERANGEVDDSLDLDHLCRNRACVNPKHLEPVPRHLNAWRGDRTKLTAQQVRAIRAAPIVKRGDLSAVARQYGVHAKTVSDIRTGENWKALA